jgi:ABC-type polysaccharide/polyol phosphate export permease
MEDGVRRTRRYLLANQACIVVVVVLLFLNMRTFEITPGQGIALVACIFLLVIFAVLEGMLFAILAEEKSP